MRVQESRLPTVSLLLSGAAALILLAVNAFPSDSRRGVLLVVCLSALAGVISGISGLRATPAAPPGPRFFAGMAIALGGAAFVWAALVLWLSTPF